MTGSPNFLVFFFDMSGLFAPRTSDPEEYRDSIPVETISMGTEPQGLTNGCAPGPVLNMGILQSKAVMQGRRSSLAQLQCDHCACSLCPRLGLCGAHLTTPMNKQAPGPPLNTGVP